MDAVLFLRQSSYSQPMELERVEAVCDSDSGTPARLWPTRGDRTRERKIAALDVGGDWRRKVVAKALDILNIGGRFPVPYRGNVPTLGQFADAIEQSLNDAFGDDHPELMLEPGRSFVAEAGVIQTEVVLVSQKSRSDHTRWVFLPRGFYGSAANPLQRDLTPYDRLRVSFDGLSQVVGVNLELFSPTGNGRSPCALDISNNSSFTADFPIADFVPGNGTTIDLHHISLVVLLTDGTSLDYGITKFEAVPSSAPPATFTCPPVGSNRPSDAASVGRTFP